jgi:hypothetical protein
MANVRARRRILLLAGFVVAVPGATHTDAYLRSMPHYSQKLSELAGQ